MTVVQCVFQSFGQEAKELFAPLSDQLLMRVRKYKYKTKEDSGRFCKELFDLWPKQNNDKYCARTVRSRGNEAFGWSRQCSGGRGVFLPWRLTLTVDITYVWCVWGNTRRGGTFKPEQHAVFGGDSILWLTRFTCLPCYWSSESLSGLAARNRRVTLRCERFFVLYIVHG